MKTKFKRISKRSLALLLGILMMFSTLMVGTITANASQYNHNWQGYVYFAAPDSWIGQNVQLIITRTTSNTESNYIDVEGSMTRLSNTNLYYFHLNADHTSWNQNEYISFAAASSLYGSGTFALTNFTYYVKPLDYGVDSSHYYLFTPASSSNNATISGTYSSSGYSGFNYTQTVTAQVSTNNGSTYSTATSSPAAIKVSSYYLNGNSSTTSGSGSITAGSSTVTATATAANTASVTYSYSGLQDGYSFAGWYNSSGTQLSSAATYTATKTTAASTVYARFIKEEQTYAVTLTNNINSTTSTIQVGSTPVAISADSISHYTFKEWKVISGSVSISGNTSSSATITATSAATIQAVYEFNPSTGYYLKGSGFTDANWDTSNTANELMYSEGDTTNASISLTLVKDTVYQFKVYDTNSGTWYGGNGSYSTEANAITDTTTVSSLSQNWGSGDNIYVKATRNGTYVISFNKSSFSITYPDLGPTTKHNLTINDPAPVENFVTDYTVTYTLDRTEITETVAKGDTISVDEDSDITITANEITSSTDGSDIVSVESWVINGIEDTSKNTKNLTLTINEDTTVYPMVYGKIKVVSVTPEYDDIDNPAVTVVMGDSADQSGSSYTYKPVITVMDSSGAVVGTFEGSTVNKTDLTDGTQYSFAPITISDLAKGEYTIIAEIIGYDSDGSKIAYGKSSESTLYVGYTYKDRAYDGNVAWVDAVPDYDDGNKATLIKWNNHTGANQTESNTYVFYLPSKVNMSSIPIYHNFSSLIIGDTSITSGNTYSFDVNTEYTISGTNTAVDGKKVKFMKGSTGSTQLYLNTTTTDESGNDIPYDLPMKTNPVADDNAAQANKESITCKGTEIAVDQLGQYTTGTLKKFKGRGNSSWKASCDLFGKYAYNMTLKDSANLFGLAGDNAKGNTKYSLLANNVDEAQSRNSYIYKLAKELGFEYFPDFQMADLYDNGVYMGSYLVTQKVELGSKAMITESEIKYDDPVDADGNTVDFDLAQGTVDGCSYQYSTNRTDSTNYNNGGTYLMEFELQDRYGAEASWFISKKGQPIVVSSPENASKNEMEYIISKWNAVEEAVYNQNIDSIRDKIDVESFAKMYLIQELSKNLDACSTSYNVLYKSAEDKFYAEPVWDFDWTLGQYCNDTAKNLVGSHTDANTDLDNAEGFFARYKGMGGSSTSVYDFEAALCQNTSFWADVVTIWKNEFYLTATSENTYLRDTYFSAIENTILMNENRWGFIANNLSSGWGTSDTGSDFATVSSSLTTWITNRLTWLNGKITSTMYTVSAGEGATMTYVDNMGNGKLNAYTQFAEGTRLTFTASRQPGMEFIGWSTDGTNVDTSLGSNLIMTVSVSKNATYTPIFEITYDTATTPVKYYVDMHSDSDLAPTINFANGDTLALTKVGTSTVYSGTYDTVYYIDDDGNIVDIVTKLDTITAGNKTLPVSTKDVLNKKCLQTGEVWIEATQSIKDAAEVDTSASAKGATSVSNTVKRIYWNNKGAYASDILFNPLSIYYWTDGSSAPVDWNSSPSMTFISDNNYYYDVPKGTDRVIFKDTKGQTVDITVTDTAYAFAPYNYHESDSSGHFYAAAWDSQPADPNPISYISSYELYVDDNNAHSIAPTLHTNAAVASYSVADESIATVAADGTITPKAVGSTKVTITVKGTLGDTATVESTINVINRPAADAAYAIMSYQSNTSTFSAVGGTIDTLTASLAGSAYAGVTTGGIIDSDKNTVTYAVADTEVTDYADLAVTVTAKAVQNENYKFINWTKNGTAISGAAEELTVALKKAAADNYVATFALDSIQMVFTYNFVDYDTSDGYEFDVVNCPTKPASYKTAAKKVLASVIDDNASLVAAAKDNAPNIISNYFTYALDENSVSTTPTLIDGIYYVTANLKETARQYKVSVGGTEVGYYYFQQEAALNASDYTESSETGYIWSINGQNTPISDKDVFTLKVANDIDLSVKVAEGDEKIKNLSIINTAYYEIKSYNDKTYVGQNFYIQNFYRQNDPVYDQDGNVVEGATDKTFEGAGILSYTVTTSTMKPVSATVRNFAYTDKDALLSVAEDIGVDYDGNSESNSIHAASGLNYSFVKGTDTIDDQTGQEFMKYSQTQGCYSYFYEAMTEQSKLYRSQSYVVYSYYVYSYKDADGAKHYVYVMSDNYATAKVYEA